MISSMTTTTTTMRWKTGYKLDESLNTADVVIRKTSRTRNNAVTVAFSPLPLPHQVIRKGNIHCLAFMSGWGRRRKTSILVAVAFVVRGETSSSSPSHHSIFIYLHVSLIFCSWCLYLLWSDLNFITARFVWNFNDGTFVVINYVSLCVCCEWGTKPNQTEKMCLQWFSGKIAGRHPQKTLCRVSVGAMCHVSSTH